MKHGVPTDFDIKRNGARVDVELFARLLKLLPPQCAFPNSFGEGTNFREDDVEVDTDNVVVDFVDELLDCQIDNMHEARDVTCLQLGMIDRRITSASQSIPSSANLASKALQRVPLFPALSQVMPKSFSAIS